MKKIILAAIMFLLWSDRALPDHFREADRRRLYHSLRQPRLSDSSYAVNDSIRIQLPDLVIHLIHGQLVPLHDSANGLTGLLFDGKARVRFAPRHEVERQQLHYFTQDSMLTRDVSHLLLRFAKIPAGAWSNALTTSLNNNFDPLPSRTRLQRVAAKVRAAAAALPSFVQKEWLQRRGFNLAAHLLSNKYAHSSSQFLLCALDWFFKQWIYGMAIPTYRWSQQVKATVSGNLVQILIQQKDAPPDFRMPVPITIEYEDGTGESRRVWVDHHGGKLSFSLRTVGVKQVVFNEGNAVLCRVKGK